MNLLLLGKRIMNVAFLDYQNYMTPFLFYISGLLIITVVNDITS